MSSPVPNPNSSMPPYDRDVDQLKLLAIFHYVVGGLTIAFSSLFIIHVVMAATMYLHPEALPFPKGAQPQPPREVWLMLGAIAGCFVLFGWMLGILTIISGRLIAKRKYRTFSLITAAVLCVMFPFGTVLGVCTLIVLSRNSVSERYAGSVPA